MITKTLGDYIEDNNLSKKIPVFDAQAWVINPDHNFVYNKLWIAQTQTMECGPMGVNPVNFPVIIKPIINLFGMSRGMKKINNIEEYNDNLKDGYFWEEYLDGKHYCLDFVIENGKIIFSSCLRSFQGENGSFEYHESMPDYKVPKHIRCWISSYLDDYTGVVNMEVINGYIIEVHLRLNGDFNLYDLNFVKELHNFYEGLGYNFSNFVVKKKFIIPVFVKKNYDINNFNKDKILKLCKKYNLCIYFDNINSKSQSEYLSRILIFDTDNFNVGIKIKEKILLSI